MWWIRCFGYIVSPCFAIFALLLTGAIAQQNPQSTPPSQSPKTPKTSPPAAESKPIPADENATKTLKVADLLDAKKLGWFTTTLWQRVDTMGLSYESEGDTPAGLICACARYGGRSGQNQGLDDGCQRRLDSLEFHGHWKYRPHGCPLGFGRKSAKF